MDQIFAKEKYGNNPVQYVTEKEYFVTRQEDGGSVISMRKINDKEKYGIVSQLRIFFTAVFLPIGYPSSVSSDYFEYQVWDTIQACCSTITGILTINAVMKAVGVGDAMATPLAATITWIAKDGSGMIGRIVFAWWKGSALDADCKKWRLAADIINDIALFLELLTDTSIFLPFSFGILCLSTVLKSIVGVAGGCTRAAITQHQAIRNNMADVSAKDGSQETCVNLISSICGACVLSFIGDDFISTWLIFFLVTMFHLYSNYRAVKCLVMYNLNTARLDILIKRFLECGIVESPNKVNSFENVFLGRRSESKDYCGYKIMLGSSLEASENDWKRNFDTIMTMMVRNQPFILTFHTNYVKAILKENISATEILFAYYSCVCFGIIKSLRRSKSLLLRNIDGSPANELYLYHARDRDFDTSFLQNIIEKHWETFIHGLRDTGWIIDRLQLEIDEWRIKCIQE